MTDKIIGKSGEPEDVEKAKEFLERLSEYKPLYLVFVVSVNKTKSHLLNCKCDILFNV